MLKPVGIKFFHQPIQGVRTIMVRFILLCLILLITGSKGFSQGLGAYEKAGKEAFADKNYRAAYEYFNFVYEVDRERHENLYDFAEAARLYKAFNRAEQGYKAVILSDHAEKYPLAPFWLAMVRKSQGEYDDAWARFSNFLDSLPSGVDEQFVQMAERQKEECLWAKEVKRKSDSPIDSILHLDTSTVNGINSPYSDFSPYWWEDKLFYSSMRYPNFNDKYRPARPLAKVMRADVNEEREILLPGDTLGGGFNNGKYHIAHTSMSMDHNRIYFSLCEYTEGLEIQCQIYFRERTEDNLWGDTINVGKAVNLMGANTAQPAIGYDRDKEREILYFASDRPGGKGKMDLYYAPLDTSGRATKVFPLTAFNTSGDEISPFFDNRYRTLYFSSDGHKSMGGYDLYRAKYRNGNWREMEHLGYPLNTSYDDTHLSLDSTGTLAFFSSNRLGVNYPDEDSKTCCPDIFSTHIDQVEVFLHLLANCQNEKVENVSFQLTDLEFDEEQQLNNLGVDTIKVELELERKYRVIAEKPGFHKDTIFISTYNLEDDTVMMNNIRMIPDVDVLVRIFDRTIDKPLKGVTARTLGEGETVIEERINTDGNEFRYENVELGKQYRFRLSKQGYISRTITVPVDSTFCEPIELPQKVSLTRIELDTITLYFDNDKPGPPRRNVSQSNQLYDDTWQDYYNRRRLVYIDQYQNPKLSPCNAKFSEEEYEELLAFFEGDLRRNYNRLDTFRNVLIEYLDELEEGQKLIIKIRGYASPSASSDYNKWLTDRRINSVRRYLSDIFDRYEKAGKLTIEEDSRSDADSTSAGIPDEEEDDCRAEYGVPAAKARRVEILGVEPGRETGGNSLQQE
jgi:tetratricopeptide (TPR) repeat protein